ncbi:MAG: hypothetical protein FJ276_05560 [Planctomycetes bacterium]|nr:hypothetical protein [Planctomycetota bacterium]
MKRDAVVAIVGDVHGHLQLACCVLARWQQELGVRFEAVLLCGDVGTFTDASQLDSATRAHAKSNPCELEFLHQWSTKPQAPWLDAIFKPEADDGLGLACPLIMVHGNHEGFSHLERLLPGQTPEEPVELTDLPGVDTNGHLRLLPSGCIVSLASGHLVAGIGGIEPGQRRAEYHSMAMIDDLAILNVLERGPVDILVTHQGPSGVQGDKGAPSLQVLLDQGIARVWFHGHSIAVSEPTRAGRAAGTLVVPLGDIAFRAPARTPRAERCEPGDGGWAIAWLREHEIVVDKSPPPFLREFHRRRWTRKDELLIAPSLAPSAWRTATGK